MRKVLLIALVASLFGCRHHLLPSDGRGAPQETPPTRQAKNVILMIGDGMGLTQISAGMYSNGDHLNLEGFNAIGLHKPYSADNLITDSAAGATAFAIGRKSYNGAIGVDADTVAHQTILEELEEFGFATGLVATSTIVHATPASFIAHVPLRKQYEDIAVDFLDTEIDYFVGGGKKYFDERETDERNIAEELEAKGYQLASYFDTDFKDVEIDPSQNFGYFTANGNPIPQTQGRDYLMDASKRGVEFLKAHQEEDKGFFLMIEGSQIDWGGHANNSDYIITEMIEFDQVIGEILNFAAADGETLVIVTADHETGGYAINPGSTRDSIVSGFTSDYHTGTMIPVFAYGPGQDLFRGIYENTDIYHKMRKALGLQPKEL